MLKLSKKQKDCIFVWSLLILPIVQWLIFWLYLNASSITLAFRDSVTDEFTLYNFEKFFKAWREGWAGDKGLKIAFVNTLIDILISNFWCMPLNIFFGYVFFKKFYLHSVLRVIFYLPVIFGEIAITIMQGYIMDATGPIVSFCTSVGIKLPFDVLQSGFYGNFLTARPTFFITRMIAVSGSSTLLLCTSLNRIPTDIFDSGKIDGFGFFREFLFIAFPLIWSTVGIMWVMQFVGGWLTYNRVMLLTGGAYNTGNLGYYLMSNTLNAVQSNGVNGTYNYPAAIGLLFSAIPCPMAIILRSLAHKWITPVEF